LFGLVIGAVAMLLRVITGLPASDYWALLAASTCVPVINRLARRPVFGVP
jgi:Na+-translocating ferredoxin:NAD+ oxidoreductase RnfD subunit